MNNLCGCSAITVLTYHKCTSAVLKVPINMDVTIKHLYKQNSPKLETAKKRALSLGLPLRRQIAQLYSHDCSRS